MERDPGPAGSSHRVTVTVYLTLPEVPRKKGSQVLAAMDASHQSTKRALRVFLFLSTWYYLTLHGTLQSIKVRLGEIFYLCSSSQHP